MEWYVTQGAWDAKLLYSKCLYHFYAIESFANLINYIKLLNLPEELNKTTNNNRIITTVKK